MGFVYPAFASWKALESQKSDNGVAHAGANGSWQNRDAWLTYWVVFSCFNVLEHVADVLISWRVQWPAKTPAQPGDASRALAARAAPLGQRR